jgi:hypothetical protein
VTSHSVTPVVLAPREGKRPGTGRKDAEPVEFPNATRCVDKSRYDEGVWAHEES